MKVISINNWKSFKLNENVSNLDLPIMYHETNQEFDQFSLKMFGLSDNGWLGKGIYFTNDYDYAKSYTDIDSVKEVKLTIKNPYIITDSIYSRRPDKLREEFNANNSTELTKKLKDLGYDSVMLKTEDGTYDKNNELQEYFYEICVFDITNIKVIKEELKENNIIILNESKDKNYLSWKRKNVTMRGISEDTDDSGFNGAGARFGDGLYTASLSNKSMAKGYGKLYFVVGARPKNPKIFDDTNHAEIWLQRNIWFKEYKNIRDFDANTNIKDEMIKLGFDGLEIKGREIVNYTPDNDNIKYFETEDQLEDYYEHNILINESNDNKLNIFHITFINSKFAISINTVNAFIKLLRSVDPDLVYNEKIDCSTNKYLNSLGNIRDIKIKSSILNVGIINELAESFIEKYDWLKIKTLQSKY